MPEPSIMDSSSASSSDPLLVQHHDQQTETDEEPDADHSKPMTSVVHKKTCHPTSSNSSRNKRLTAMLAWYARFCGSASHQDKLLKIIQWTLSLISTARQQWPNKVALEISFARYVTRLLHFPVALEAATNDSWVSTARSASNSLRYKWIGRVLAYSMVVYYPTEHMAYVLWMKPSSKSATTATCSSRASLVSQCIPSWSPEKWSYISCRFWCAYIVAELAQNILQLRELMEEEDEDEERKSSAIVDTQLQLARNALFLLPSIHWSLSSWDTKPWLRGRTVTWMMWAEAVVSFYQAYRKSA